MAKINNKDLLIEIQRDLQEIKQSIFFIKSEVFQIKSYIQIKEDKDKKEEVEVKNISTAEIREGWFWN